MTIKVYKKQTHWYYMYHCKEYDLGKLEYLNLFEKLLDSKIIYFDLSYLRIENRIGVITSTRFNRKRACLLDTFPFTIFLKESFYPQITLPKNIITPLYISYKSCIK